MTEFLDDNQQFIDGDTVEHDIAAEWQSVGHTVVSEPDGYLLCWEHVSTRMGIALDDEVSSPTDLYEKMLQNPGYVSNRSGFDAVDEVVFYADSNGNLCHVGIANTQDSQPEIEHAFAGLVLKGSLDAVTQYYDRYTSLKVSQYAKFSRKPATASVS